MKTLRRKDRNNDKVIADKKPITDQLKAVDSTNELLHQINNTTSVSTSASVSTSKNTADISAGTEMMIDIQSELLDAAKSGNVYLAGLEANIKKLQNHGISPDSTPDDISSQYIQEYESAQKQLLSDMHDMQEWMDMLAEEAQRHTGNTSTGALPVPEVQAVPVVTPQKPVEPEVEKTTPTEKPKKERGSAFGDSALNQFKLMNRSLVGISGSLSRIVFQMTLESVKMAGAILAGVVAIDFLITTVQNLWEKYGDAAEEAWESAKGIFTDVKDAVLNIWNSSQVQEMISAIKTLALDFKNGDFMHGIGNYLKTAFNVFTDQLSVVGEAIVRAIPGGGGTADSIAVARARAKVERGVTPTKQEMTLLNTADREAMPDTTTDKARLAQQQDIAVGMYAKKNGINLPRNEAGTYMSRESSEYKSIKEIVTAQRPELRDSTDDGSELRPENRDLTIAINGLAYAIKNSADEPTAGDMYNINKAQQRLNELNIDNSTGEAAVSLHKQYDTLSNQAYQLQQKNMYKDYSVPTQVQQQEDPLSKQLIETHASAQKDTDASRIASALTHISTVNNNQTMIAPAVTELPGFNLR